MRVVVVGAGPAGLQVASVLIRIGCSVVVYDLCDYQTIINKSVSSILPEMILSSKSDRLPLQEYIENRSLDHLIFYNSKVIRVEKQESLYLVYYERHNSLYYTTCDYFVIATGSHKYIIKPPPDSNRFRGPVSTLNNIPKSRIIAIIHQEQSCHRTLKTAVKLLKESTTQILLITRYSLSLETKTHQIKPYYSERPSLIKCIKRCMNRKYSFLSPKQETEFLQEMIKTGRLIIYSNRTVSRYERDGIVLSSGEKLYAEALVFADASALPAPFLSRSLLDGLYQQSDGLYNYRKILPPKIHHMAFIGTEIDTYDATLVSFVQSVWLASYILHKQPKKTKPEMVQEIKQERMWRKKRFAHLPISEHASALYSYSEPYMHQMLKEASTKSEWKELSSLSIHQIALCLLERLEAAVPSHIKNRTRIKQLLAPAPNAIYEAIKRKI